jgi:hypothetical protein
MEQVKKQEFQSSQEITSPLTLNSPEKSLELQESGVVLTSPVSEEDETLNRQSKLSPWTEKRLSKTERTARKGWIVSWRRIKQANSEPIKV